MVGTELNFVHLSMLKLILLRHAKTNQWSQSGRDFDRELLPKGINQGKELAKYFELQSFQNISILVSPAIRTRQTFEFLHTQFDPNMVRFLDSIYLCSYPTLFDEMCLEKKSKTLLIVGHNFGISDLATYLTERTIELRTGELIEITFDCDSWEEVSKGMGTIRSLYRPDV